MPEPVELGVRRGERRRVTVAERHDGDAGREVEVLTALTVVEAAAEPVDERDAGGGIGREERGARDRAHAVTAVSPISAATPLRAADAAASSFGTMPPSNAPPSTSAWARCAAIVCTRRPS